jgi:O-antigen/teichoic acid export membrane protein
MASSVCNSELSTPCPQSLPQQAQIDPGEKQSYSQILKSSALVGGSSVLNIVVGIVRTKAMAVLLGPSGFGLFGLYGSIANLTQSIAGIGINSSGVRQIAEAVGSDNTERIALTTAVLRRTSIFLGVLGAGLLLVFSPRCPP